MPHSSSARGGVLRAVAREPLLHFALVGALIFAAYGWLAGRDATSDASGEIRVSRADVDWLAGMWTRQWQREPSREELRGLVTDLLREQLLAHEARELGLDEDDTIVRRRLAQKLEFLVRDTAALGAPTERDLRRLYDASPELFRSEARVSLRHVFFSPERSDDADAAARRALTRLRDAHSVPDELGDPLLIEPELRDAGESTIAGLFGSEFASQVMALPPGRWAGPIASAYGLHLVRVDRRDPAKQDAFSEVRTQLVERWRAARERDANEAFFGSLLDKYDVVVDEEVERLLGGPIDPFAVADG